jgi:hypothetical protein
MVNYTKLVRGKKYKLGDINLGKFIRSENDNGEIVLYFLDSQFGEKGENPVYPDDDDNFIEIKQKTRSRRKSKSKSKSNSKTRSKSLSKSK